jgi:hypothetical protein
MNKAQFYDPARGRDFRALPEELVRRQLLEWLVNTVGVPRRLIAVEYPLSKLDPRCRKRADLVVWKPSREGGMEPWLLAECKAPGVKLVDGVADQVRGYAEKVRAEHVLLTNGSEVRMYRRAENQYDETGGLPVFIP